MARYFVTGATGFLGGELVKQLIGRGHQVTALIRSPAKANFLKTLGVVLHDGDITDRESLRAPMLGVDGVFHVAAWYKVGVADPSGEAARVNVEGTRHVLELARDLAIPRVVYTSTLAIFGNTGGRAVDETFPERGPWLSEYDRTKRIAHDEVALPLINAGLPLMIALPGAIYGPGDTSDIHRTLVQLLRKRLFVTPRNVTFSWGYVEDTARGLRQVMDSGRPGESYILAGPTHTFEEAFDLAARIAKRRPPFVHPPASVMRAAAGLAAAMERLDLRPPVAAETLRVMAGTTWVSASDKAARELGFTARPLEEGLRHTIEHELRQLGMG